ncbi:type VI secretion system tube protein Hcp [Pseudacidovorax intermedius]|uniref:Uncharacterized protein n=1 Tax=Pseudacidovorax intermedius TaxID=433924 RepID=A0A147GRX3_9BURK|nr:type VI secretion system tube protein Hcp [Pseudacidovorax intermedius]KTT19812.1 hypothetical protein NS331_14340 [Pseudacidovorax intermedius]
MAFNLDGVLDPDEALRLIEAMTADNGNDIVMALESRGTAVEGECQRPFADGRRRMDVAGYSFFMRTERSAGAARGQLELSGVHVVRRCDAATASLASLHQSQDPALKLTLSVFKAGGDNSGDAQPMLEFAIEKARIYSHALLVGGNPKEPWEVIGVAYQKLELRSAPQTREGIRGAVRTCTLEVRA